MKFFIDSSGAVRAFEDDAQDALHDGMRPISESEALELVRQKQPTSAEMLEVAKSELRTMRAPMLDALTGIAGRATRAGNEALATEADALAVNLLAITDDATLNAATTYEAMQAAGVSAYKRIAGASSAELAVVFREITGA